MPLQYFVIPRVKNTWVLLLSREVTGVNDCVSDDHSVYFISHGSSVDPLCCKLLTDTFIGSGFVPETY